MKRNPFLRVKLKSLAAEAKIIRQEERKANKHRDFSLQNELADHRKIVVRREARATLLAYQYLRGVPYSACETPNPDKKNPPDWDRVERMVTKYGRKNFDREQWVSGKERKPVRKLFKIKS